MAEKAKKDTKKKNNKTISVEELQAAFEEVQKKLTEQEEITKRAQSDYFRLKMDMDAYMTRAEQAKKESKVDAIISIWQKILPFVTQLEQSIAQFPEAIEKDPWSEWIRLLYTKSVSDLETLWITPIVANVWTDPDMTLHIPVSMQDTSDEALKGKILQQLESGREYRKDETHKVIVPAKIIVGT